MGKAERRKGHAFEREIARELRDIGFPDAERQLESQVSQANGIDLRNTGPFKIQCKCRKTYVSVETINEIQCDDDDWPVLITKKTGKRDPMAVLPWSVLKKLIANYSKRWEM